MQRESAIVLDYLTVVVEVVGSPCLFVDVVVTSGGGFLLCGSLSICCCPESSVVPSWFRRSPRRGKRS